MENEGYYSQLISAAWKKVDLWTSVLALLALTASYVLGRTFPALGFFGLEAERVMPVAALIVIGAWALFSVPKQLYESVQDRNAKLLHEITHMVPSEQHEQLKREHQEVLGELQEKRDCQKLADYLTDRHHYGLHKLLQTPYSAAGVSLNEWNRWVNNWLEEIRLTLVTLGGTKQDLEHIVSINLTSDLPTHMPYPSEQATKMLEVRLKRINEIANRYAKRAEDVALAATRRH